MKYTFIILIIVCMYSCVNKKKQQSQANLFAPYEQEDRYPLDIAIEKSQKEDKPILLWVSYPGNSTDDILMKMLSQISSVREYMLDSMINCRLMIGDKLNLRTIKNSTMRSLISSEEKFKTDGQLSKWICDKFFDGQNQFLIVTNSQLDKLTTYHFNKNFDHDTTSFLTFLKKGYSRYKR